MNVLKLQNHAKFLVILKQCLCKFPNIKNINIPNSIAQQNQDYIVLLERGSRNILASLPTVSIPFLLANTFAVTCPTPQVISDLQ